LVDLQGRVIGMTVLGPRRRALSIPSSTIDRTVDQLLARGHVFRGYLGAGLHSVKAGTHVQWVASFGRPARRSGREHRLEAFAASTPTAAATMATLAIANRARFMIYLHLKNNMRRSAGDQRSSLRSVRWKGGC